MDSSQKRDPAEAQDGLVQGPLSRPRRARVAFFPLRREVDPSGELEASKTFLDLSRRQSARFEVVNLAEVGDLSRGLSNHLWANLKRMAGLRKSLRTSSLDLLVIKIPTPAQIALLRPLLFDFKGPVVFWCDSLCFEFPSLSLGFKMLTREPFLTGAQAVLNGRSWLRLGGPRGRYVVVATQVQRAQLIALGWDSSFVRVIPNSSNLVFEKSVVRASTDTPEPLRLGYMGHLHCVKGVSDLLASLKTLLEGAPRFSFHFAVSPFGPRGLLPEFHDPRITISHVVDRTHFLSGLDLLVLPYWANWGTNVIPTILLEAMSIGVPVLIPDTPLSREVFGEDYPGLYARSDEAALHRAIHGVLSDPRKRPSGTALRERFLARYSPKQVEAAWLAFLDEVLA